jgi:hypothetical protein
VRKLPIEAPRASRTATARGPEATPRPRHAVTEAPRAAAPPGAPPEHTVVQVLDPHGDPVAGAAIETVRGTFRTDRGGRACIPPLPGDLGSPSTSKRRGTVRVRAAGYAPVHRFLAEAQLPSFLRDPKLESAPIRLKDRGVKLAAQFVDPRGEPIQRLAVAINETATTRDFWLVTDADGRIATDHAPPRACAFRLESDTWMARETHLRPGRQKIIVYRFARMRGRIRPAPGDDRVELCTGRRVWVDYRGRFELDCIPGRVTLLCRKRGLVLGTFHLAPGERRDGVEIALPR